jgi:hypothetical protein
LGIPSRTSEGDNAKKSVLFVVAGLMAFGLQVLPLIIARLMAEDLLLIAAKRLTKEWQICK